MGLKDILSVVAGVLFITAFIPYIRAILRRETQPAKATWLIWASLDSIIFTGMLTKHALNGQIVGAMIGAWTVVVLGLKYGNPGWTRLDKFCFAGAVLGIALWRIFSNPVLGILTSLSVAFLGSIPTFASAWHDPSKEDRTAWTIIWISCVVAVIAIPALTLVDAAQPITFFVIQSILLFILYTRPRVPTHTA